MRHSGVDFGWQEIRGDEYGALKKNKALFFVADSRKVKGEGFCPSQRQDTGKDEEQAKSQTKDLSGQRRATTRLPAQGAPNGMREDE